MSQPEDQKDEPANSLPDNQEFQDDTGETPAMDPDEPEIDYTQKSHESFHQSQTPTPTEPQQSTQDLPENQTLDLNPPTNVREVSFGNDDLQAVIQSANNLNEENHSSNPSPNPSSTPNLPPSDQETLLNIAQSNPPNAIPSHSPHRKPKRKKKKSAETEISQQSAITSRHFRSVPAAQTSFDKDYHHLDILNELKTKELNQVLRLQLNQEYQERMQHELMLRHQEKFEKHQQQLAAYNSQINYKQRMHQARLQQVMQKDEDMQQQKQAAIYQRTKQKQQKMQAYEAMKQNQARLQEKVSIMKQRDHLQRNIENQQKAEEIAQQKLEKIRQRDIHKQEIINRLQQERENRVRQMKEDKEIRKIIAAENHQKIQQEKQMRNEVSQQIYQENLGKIYNRSSMPSSHFGSRSVERDGKMNASFNESLQSRRQEMIKQLQIQRVLMKNEELQQERRNQLLKKSREKQERFSQIKQENYSHLEKKRMLAQLKENEHKKRIKFLKSQEMAQRKELLDKINETTDKVYQFKHNKALLQQERRQKRAEIEYEKEKLLQLLTTVKQNNKSVFELAERLVKQEDINDLFSPNTRRGSHQTSIMSNKSQSVQRPKRTQRTQIKLDKLKEKHYREMENLIQSEEEAEQKRMEKLESCDEAKRPFLERKYELQRGKAQKRIIKLKRKHKEEMDEFNSQHVIKQESLQKLRSRKISVINQYKPYTNPYKPNYLLIPSLNPPQISSSELKSTHSSSDDSFNTGAFDLISTGSRTLGSFEGFENQRPNPLAFAKAFTSNSPFTFPKSTPETYYIYLIS